MAERKIIQDWIAEKYEGLKKCPFCGGDPVMTTSKTKLPSSGNVIKFTRVACTTCFCGSGHFSNKDDAATAWNQRVVSNLTKHKEG